jgi:hypothetical protein
MRSQSNFQNGKGQVKREVALPQEHVGNELRREKERKGRLLE